MFPHLSDYRRRQLLEKQYGQGISDCPMAGKLVPELVGGMLHDACARTWALRETTLFLAPWEGSVPLSPEDWKLVLDDFHKGETATLAYLKLKTSYIQRLPWMLMALAHTCEEVAREFDRKIIAASMQVLKQP